VFTGACWDTCVIGEEDIDTAAMMVNSDGKENVVKAARGF
jgi:hypothetical protein